MKTKRWQDEIIRECNLENIRRWRIKGSTEIVEANCAKTALLKLVDSDGDFTYRNHWYTRSNRRAWAEFETSYGYKGIIEEIGWTDMELADRWMSRKESE